MRSHPGENPCLKFIPRTFHTGLLACALLELLSRPGADSSIARPPACRTALNAPAAVQGRPAKDPDCLHAAGACALKRPKPGSIWQGPRELWCALPRGRPGNAAKPVLDAALPDGPPGTEPRAPCLSPLLFFLTTLPSFEEVASYFAGALGETPVPEGEQKLRFERRLIFAWGNSWRRCILSGGARGAPGLTLDWWANDDFGLSELREFFEAPFFRRRDSERFHQWLGEGGVHEANFRGYRLRMVVGRRGEVIFVRIQWWRPFPGVEMLDGTHQPPIPGQV